MTLFSSSPHRARNSNCSLRSSLRFAKIFRVPVSPSSSVALAGAMVLVNLSASNATIRKNDAAVRRLLTSRPLHYRLCLLRRRERRTDN